MPIDFFFGYAYAQRIETKREQGQKKQERRVAQEKGIHYPCKGVRNASKQFRQRGNVLVWKVHCPLEIAGSQKAKQRTGKSG